MHFSLSTIATATLIIAAVEAFPHRPHGTGVSGHHSGRPQGTGVPFPFGASIGTQNGGRNCTGGHGNGKGGKGRFTRLPSEEFTSDITTDLLSGALSTTAPSDPAPTDAPTVTELPNVSSISFELPGTLNNAVNAAADSTDKSTKTKKSKSAKTETAEATATATPTDSGDDEAVPISAATSAVASASSPADDGETSSKTSAAVSEPTGSAGGNSTSSGGSTTASKTFPTAAGESTLSEPMVVTGEFDGGMVRFGRGVSCTGQSEGGNSDAVFQVEEGGTLKNVIIGADQIEGVHCLGACTIENVWWEAVCEDALTLKQTAGTSFVIGGGAKGASDKVFQHNGAGTLNVKGFYASDFGKLYRSCGNCKSGMFERHVIMDGVIADGGSATLVGINTNYGDTATITNSCITNTDPICTEFEGNDTGAEPSEVSTGISASCIYTAADIAAC